MDRTGVGWAFRNRARVKGPLYPVLIGMQQISEYLAGTEARPTAQFGSFESELGITRSRSIP